VVSKGGRRGKWGGERLQGGVHKPQGMEKRGKNNKDGLTEGKDGWKSHLPNNSNPLRSLQKIWGEGD